MLSPSALDALLAILSASDSPFRALRSSFQQRFSIVASDTTPHALPSRFLTQCATARFFESDGEEGEDQPALRPLQRLAALYIIACGGVLDEISPASSPTVRWSTHPFLGHLLQQLDRYENLLPKSPAQAAQIKLSPSLLERCFILQLLLPHLYPRLPSIESESPKSWCDQAVANSILHEPCTLQSSIDLSSPLADALAPLRFILRSNQPPPALIPVIVPSLVSKVILPANLSAIIGPTTFAALTSNLTAVPSTVSNSSSASTGIQLHLTCPLPRFSSLEPTPILPLNWNSDSSEIQWMSWDPPEGMIWELPPPLTPSIVPLSPATSGGNNISILITKALRTQLLSGERSSILAEMKSGAPQSGQIEPSSTLRHILELIPPIRLSQLVEKNHELARELLLQFITLTLNRSAAGVTQSLTSPPTSINDYLTPLIHMDMSLHSMELVKDLALVDQVALPADFLHIYICKCLTSTSKLQDKFLQNRHVRLICVFLQALMRHKLISLQTNGNATATSTTPSVSVTDATSTSSSSAASSPSPVPTSTSDNALADVRDVLFVEVQSFLVEFSRIKEAANLYRIIKQMEASAT